jgi:hypothetical protein
LLVSNDKPKPPDNPSAERIILGEMSPPVEPDERLVQVLADGGKEREALAGACLSWLVAGCADYVQHGLGAVPSMATVPQGLDQWWQESVAAGEIRPQRGQASLVEVAAHFAAWTERMQAGIVSDRELAKFLMCRVGSKRTKAVRRYHLTISATGDGR